MVNAGGEKERRKNDIYRGNCQRCSEQTRTAPSVKVARTVEEAATLTEHGFDYVTEIEGFKLFRKPK